MILKPFLKLGITWCIDLKRNKPFIVYVWYLLHILVFGLKISIQIKWCALWTKFAYISRLISVFFCFSKPLNQIFIFSPTFLVVWSWFYAPFKMELFFILILTEKLTSFYLILLDLSLGLPLILTFEQKKEIQNEGSPFVQWLTLTSEMNDCNGALPLSLLLISYHPETP